MNVPAPTCSVSVSCVNPGGTKRLHQGRGEMKRRGRRGNGTGFAREHRLIVLSVRASIVTFARNIRGQRHGACAFKQNFDRLFAFKMKQEAAIGIPHLRHSKTPDPKSIVSPGRSRLALRMKASQSRGPSRLWSVAPMRALPRTPLELRWNDPRVVEHQAIACAQYARQDREPHDPPAPRLAPQASAPHRAGQQVSARCVQAEV